MIDLKNLLRGKIKDITGLVDVISKSYNRTAFTNVSELVAYKRFSEGEIYETANSKWIVTHKKTTLQVNDGLYLIAIGDVYVEDFNDGQKTQSEYVSEANNYCMHSGINNRLVFDGSITYNFDAETSFEIVVESGGWYCPSNCVLRWNSSPINGYAIKVRGRHKYESSYSNRVNDSNYCPLEGFNIGQYQAQRYGCGLQIGCSDTLNSMTNAYVTSKFCIKRVSIFDFDDVVNLFPGVWACEIYQVNTMGGSWNSPFYFPGLDFGESIKITNCFIADNHKRLIDKELGAVYFNTGEFIVSGCSFDNMKVVVDGDACVKMFAPHFENPVSKATNKRYLEVIGNHAYCVLNSPQIVIRDTYIYSTLFYSKGYTDNNRHPASGGLVLISPSYQSKKKYRPDLAALHNTDEQKHDSDGFLELVGGDGRVQLLGGASINSLFYTYFPIPISKNLEGASLHNYSFSEYDENNKLTGWHSEEKNGTIHKIVDVDLSEGVGISLQGTQDFTTSLSQRIGCTNSRLCLGYIKYKFIEKSNLKLMVFYFDSYGNNLERKYYKKINSEVTDGLLNSYMVDIVPVEAVFAEVKISFESDDNEFKMNNHLIIDSIVINFV